MKINFHYHFYSKIFISLLIFACGFFLWQKSVDTRALVDNVYQNNTPIVGWAWNDKMGWIALNCANDFNGDGEPDGGRNADGTGWGSCAMSISGIPTSWGLKMHVDQVNSDRKYVQGCAWAGNIVNASPAESAPGWICFSDTASNSTEAPPQGVVMSESASSYSTCSCQMIAGVCEGPIANNLCINDGTQSYCSIDAVIDKCVTDPDGSKHCAVDRNDKCITESDGRKHCDFDPTDPCNVDSDCVSSCTVDSDCLSLCSTDSDCHIFNQIQGCSSFSQCSGMNLSQVTNYCQSDNTCSKSKNDCSQRGDEDCQFACVSPSPVNPGSAFLLNGVCFDYTNYTQTQKNTLLSLRGDVPPFSTGDTYMHSCYINKDCYDINDSRNAGHPDGECVYPQYGDNINGGGAGTCMVNSATPQADGATCVYDFDCAIENGNYCALSLNATLPNAPTSCTSPMCTGGYEQVTRVVTQSAHVNALSSDPLAADGFASILQLEPLVVAGYSGANRLGFPIKSRVVDSAFPDSDPNYDVDNPNNRTSGDNPIRGCFNCYKEKEYSCLSGVSCTCDQADDSCNDSACAASSDGSEYCAVSAFQPAVCENCQEYFYYSEDQSTCSIRTDRVCSAGNPCPTGFGVCGSHKVGDLKKVLTGFNCTECTVDNFSNSCSLNASNINSNSCKRCETRISATTLESNVYRMGGVLYDNQHGRSSTSTLCGWAYNSWSVPDGSDLGFGWFNFSPRISTSTKPYFSVEQGNIYSRGRIGTAYQPPINRYNASYLIEAGGSIKNFVSGASKNSNPALPSFQGELPNRPFIDFLSSNLSTGQYQNALGKLDYNGLITKVKTVGGIDYNKYGSIIEKPISNFENIFNGPLTNTVFYVSESNIPSGTVTIGGASDLEVLPGAGVVSGAGIIVIEGNLRINKNITYRSSATISNLKQIPSLVWVVKGDVIIDTSVQDVVGTFIVLGDGTSCASADPSGCGQFKSGLTGQRPLLVRGNVLARKFVLERIYVDQASGTPAEQFINDGRLQSNPPLGLTDMSRVIPRFSSY